MTAPIHPARWIRLATRTHELVVTLNTLLELGGLTVMPEHGKDAIELALLSEARGEVLRAMGRVNSCLEALEDEPEDVSREARSADSDDDSSVATAVNHPLGRRWPPA